MVKADSSDRIKRALKQKQVPGYLDIVYERGDNVLFIDKNDEWCGPAEIEAVDGCNVILKYNGNPRNVHKCNVRLLNESDLPMEDEESTEDDTSSEEEDEENEETDVEVISVTKKDIMVSGVTKKDATEVVPKKGSLIKFKLHDSDWKTGEVIDVGKKEWY